MYYYKKGLTLIELLVVISIIAILAFIGAPSYDSFIKENNLTASVNTLLTELQFARTEARKGDSDSVVTICASTNGTSCNSSDWEKGRIVFVDDGAGTAANKGNGVIDSGENILKVYGQVETGITITPSLSSGTGYIAFSKEDSTAVAKQTGTLIFCDDRAEPEAVTVLYAESRKAYDSDEALDGIVNDLSGSNITCP